MMTFTIHFAAKLRFKPPKLNFIRFRMTPSNNPWKSSIGPILQKELPNGVVEVTLIGFFDRGSASASVT